MSQFDLLRSEIIENLQCPICYESFTQPKVAGACQHTFCQECLRSNVERQVREGDNFSCPLCHKGCTMPPGGISGLPDNFLIANISNVLSRTLRRRSLSRTSSEVTAEHQCTSCKSAGVSTATAAEFVCETCENTRLCVKCKATHGTNEITSGHKIVPISVKKNFGVCEKHPGQGLELFCLECDKVLCELCKPGHAGENIAELAEVIKDLKTELTEQISETKSTILNVVAEEHKMVDIRNVIYEEMGGLVQEVEGHADLFKTAVERQKQKLISRIKTACDVTDVCVVISDLEGSRQEMENATERGEVQMKTNVTTLEDIKKIRNLKDEMKELQSNLKSIDYDQYKERLAKMSSFEPCAAEVNIGTLRQPDLVVAERKPQVMQKVEAEEARFTTKSFRKLLSLHFPVNLQCHDVRSVTYLPYERFAVLAAVPGEIEPADRNPLLSPWVEQVDTIFISQAGPDGVCHVCRMISNGVRPAEDMAVTTRGELVVVRREKPYIKLFDPENGNSRSIKIKDDLDGPWSIAVDSRGRFLVLDGWPECHVLVIAESGELLQMLNVEGEHWRIASYGMVLYSCGEWEISAYRVQGDTVEKSMSFEHGVEGVFTVTDICTLKDHVYVAGRAGEGEVGVFEVIEAERDGVKAWEMKGLALVDGKGAELGLKADGWRVSIDVRDNKLLLGYNDHLGHVALVTLVLVE
ncbi:uncharacterized protein LOC135500010 [Lineus longissimus]|uniref:uncharacterized protein LOC135500010 n=1 Tax=Lineus longissimus TaxID=88925 RepID=UPI002B4F5E53